MEQRVAAKLARLTMSAELGKMLTAIPVDVRENAKTDCVYLGSGTVRGLEGTKVTVTVSLKRGKKVAAVQIGEKEFSGPFDTETEQETFPSGATRFIMSRMN